MRCGTSKSAKPRSVHTAHAAFLEKGWGSQLQASFSSDVSSSPEVGLEVQVVGARSEFGGGVKGPELGGGLESGSFCFGPCPSFLKLF
mmetsp:Transcript_44114/g.93940  ORF Transcript_44114/g.93940 Transcript_44114/m.93940 type:complete len:88 (-) Transcript_44114:1799-2062(-)